MDRFSFSLFVVSEQYLLVNLTKLFTHYARTAGYALLKFLQESLLTQTEGHSQVSCPVFYDINAGKVP